jgi:hypothetical protein
VEDGHQRTNFLSLEEKVEVLTAVGDEEVMAIGKRKCSPTLDGADFPGNGP